MKKNVFININSSAGFKLGIFWMNKLYSKKKVMYQMYSVATQKQTKKTRLLIFITGLSTLFNSETIVQIQIKEFAVPRRNAQSINGK